MADSEDQDYQDYLDYLEYQKSQSQSQKPVPEETYASRLKNNLVAAADAASFGLADEGAAYTRSAIGKLQSALGYEPSYKSADEELSAIRGGMKDYASNHPYQALASALIGGVAGSAPIAAEAATSKAVPSFMSTIASGAKTGALYGGAYGFGSGENGVTNRLVSALIGSGTGAAGGAALGGAAYGAGKGIQSLLGYADALNPASETGALLPTVGEGEAASLTPAQEYLAKRVRNVPTEDLQTAQATLESALADQSPMFLPESLPQSPGLTRLTRYLGGHEPSMDIVQGAVDARKAGALDRVTGILDEMSPERSAVNAGETVQGIIGDIKDKILEVRRKDAAPLYKALSESEGFNSEAVKDAISLPRVKTAIKKVRQELPELEGKSDLDFSVLDQAKQWLYKEAESEKNGYVKSAMDKARTKLVGAMDAEMPAYAKARAIFEDDSTPLNQLFDGTKKPFINLTKNNAENVGTALLGLDKQRLSDIADEFGPNRAQALKDAVRAALQGKIESKNDNRNLVDGIVNNQAMREKLRIIVADDQKFDRLMKLLGREHQYAQAANKYHAGSSTHGNFEEADGLSQAANTVSKIIKAAKNAPGAMLDYAVRGRGLNEEMARKLAAALTDTQQGVNFFQQTLPYLEAQRAQAAAVQAVAQPLGQAGGVASPIFAGSLISPRR